MPNDTTSLASAAATEAQAHRFVTTEWSVVLCAQDSTLPDAATALEHLCRNYWYPLYAFLRRAGEPEAAAKDITQGFFARLIEKNYLEQVDREKGKFRSFLLAALRHYLADERDRERAQKRGGGRVISIHSEDAEACYALEPADLASPEKLYERKWAVALLGRGRQTLAEEYAGSGKSAVYDILNRLEAREPGLSYTQAGEILGWSESAIKSALFRFRQRYRELVRREVAKTVGDEADVDEELRHMIRVLSE
jgi:RNA polymerase sigma-70 factor (ECF subfamily)